MSGSPTSTGWKRRSSAASFSMCLRYSSSVVAPTARSSPRASIGFSRLAASTAPSAAPAPTIVWSSSMNRTIVPLASAISLRTAFGDRRLADAGLADQHRVVLGATAQHLDHSSDLVVAADHRVELAAG